MARNDEQEDANRIKVTDRRSFTREGERREDAPPPESGGGGGGATPLVGTPPSAADAGPARPAEPGRGREKPQPQPPPAAPEAQPSIDFVAFVQSLYVSAMMSLGEIENPYTRQFETNLDIARQNIDILTMLADKTRGNLDAEEDGLLGQVLPQLQLLYVKKVS